MAPPTDHEAGRERLRTTFEQVADTYQQARPEYPEALFDDLVLHAGLRIGSAVLEVGCATGKATLPLARRGFNITCVELAESLAAVARKNLAGFADVTIETTSFEKWDPRGRSFDLLVAATSWHWVDPAVGFHKAWELLRPGGYLAVWAASHVIPEGGDTFFEDLQPVYDEIGEGMPGGWTSPRPGELPEITGQIEQTGMFTVVHVRHFDWEQIYDAEEYIQLLMTFSNHIAMAPWHQERLYGEIRQRLSARKNGRLRRHWGAVLHIARRLERA